MPETEDLYAILHLHPSAHPDVIQAAYRRLALLYHPDKNLSSETTETMATINRAYAVLSDPEQRAKYDRRREAWADPHRSSPSAASSSQTSGPQSSPPRNPTGYFTLGSTKSEVADIHGPPHDLSIDQTVREEIWHYGSDDTIEFDLDTGKVQGWSNIRGNLRIQLIPGPNVTSAGFFVIGNHRDEVAHLHGTPPVIVARQELDREFWIYPGTKELNSVEFSFATGRVTGWENNDGLLKTRRSSSSSGTSASGNETNTSSNARAGSGSNWRTIKGESSTAIMTDNQFYPADCSLMLMLGRSGIAILVNWGTTVSYSDTVSVAYKIDDGPIWQQSWVVDTDGTTTFLPAPENNEMLQELFDSQTLTVMSDSMIESSAIAQFDIHGFREAVAPLLNEWDRRRNSPPSSGYSYQSPTANASPGYPQTSRSPNYGGTTSSRGYSSDRPASSTTPHTRANRTMPDSRYEPEDSDGGGCGIFAGSIIATIVATGLAVLLAGICTVALS